MNTDTAVYGVGIVVHDPDCEAGFPAGAKLNGIWPSLRLGIFTTGTILLVDGRRMRVRGDVGQQQRLERVS